MSNKKSSGDTAASRDIRGLLFAGATVALTAAAFFAGPASAASRSVGPDAGHGKALYGQYCVACHGPNGIGEFNWQNRPRGAPALDSSGHAWHHEDAQLLSMILDKPVPDSRMPAWRNVISSQDAQDLLAYVKTLWTQEIRDNCQGAKHMQCMMRMMR